jgi:hypothetical protein
MNKSIAKLTSPYGRQFEFPLENVRKAEITRQSRFLFDVKLYFSDLSSFTLATHGTIQTVTEAFQAKSISVEIFPW